MLALCCLTATAGAQSATNRQEPAPGLSYFEGFECDQVDISRAAGSAASIRLNALGLEACRKGLLIEAAKLFRCAIQEDNAHSYAHYNYASVLALLANGIPSFVQIWMEMYENDFDSLDSVDYSLGQEYRTDGRTRTSIWTGANIVSQRSIGLTVDLWEGIESTARLS